MKIEKLQCFFILIYFISFLWIIYVSVEKYLSKFTFQENRYKSFVSLNIFIKLFSVIETKSLQYPSVSICVEYTFKKYIDNIISNSSFSVEEAEAIAKSLLWKRNETFFFVNHKTIDRDDFPCMTMSESADPGRPCIFPFVNEL